MFRVNVEMLKADLGIFTHIPAYSSILRYIQAIYPGIIRIYSGIFRTLCNPSMYCITLLYSEHCYIESKRHIQNIDTFRELANSEQEACSDPWYIQDPGIFRTLVYSGPWYIQDPGIFRRTLVYSEHWHIQNQRHIQNHKIFRIQGIF